MIELPIQNYNFFFSIITLFYILNVIRVSD